MDGRLKKSARLTFEEARIFIRVLGVLLLSTISELSPMLFDLVVDVLLELSHELLGGVAEGVDHAEVEEDVIDVLVGGVELPRVAQLGIADLLKEGEGLLDGHVHIGVQVEGLRGAVTLALLVLLNDHLVRVLLILILAVGFVRLVGPAFKPVPVEVVAAAHLLLADALLLQGEADLDLREEVTNLLFVAVVDTFKCDALVNATEYVKIFIQIDIGRPPMGNP